MELRPGGSFVTQISENGGDFMPHLDACFLAIDDRMLATLHDCFS